MNFVLLHLSRGLGTVKKGRQKEENGLAYFTVILRFCFGVFLGRVTSRTPSERSAVTSSTFISSGNSTSL